MHSVVTLWFARRCIINGQMSSAGVLSGSLRYRCRHGF